MVHKNGLIIVYYHCCYGSWFLYPEGLDDLEDVHHSLCLAALNGGGDGTKHPRTAHRVTEGGRKEVSHNPTAVGAWLPAVDDDRCVSRLPLDFAHLINHLQNTLEVGTLATGGPVLDLELGHTMRILTLHGTAGGSHTYRRRSWLSQTLLVTLRLLTM